MLLGLISENPYLNHDNNNISNLNYISDFENNYKKNEIREKIGNFICEYIKINNNNFNEFIEKSISKIPYLYKWGFLFIEILKIKFINKTLIEKFHCLILEDKKNYEIKNLDNQNITNNNNNNVLLGKKRNLSPIKKTENLNPNIKISPNKKNITNNNNNNTPNKKINEIFKPLFNPKDFSNASKIIETQRKINFDKKNSYSSLPSLPTSSSSKISINSKDNNFTIPSSYETISSFSNSNFLRNNSDFIQENYSFREKDNLSLDSSFIFSRNDSFSNLSETNKKSYNGINFRLNYQRLENAIKKSASSKKNYHSKSNSLSKLETVKKMIEEKEKLSFEYHNSTEKKSIIDSPNTEFKKIVREKSFYNISPIDKNKIEKNNNLIDNNNKIIALKTPEKKIKNDDYENKLKDKCKKNLHAYFSQKQIF